MKEQDHRLSRDTISEKMMKASKAAEGGAGGEISVPFKYPEIVVVDEPMPFVDSLLDTMEANGCVISDEDREEFNKIYKRNKGKDFTGVPKSIGRSFFKRKKKKDGKYTKKVKTDSKSKKKMRKNSRKKNR